MRWEKERFAVIARVRDTLRRWPMFAPGDEVIAAVSGGADSLVLLDVLVQMKEELGIGLRVLHVDHGVRPASGEDAAWVQGVATHYRLPCSVRRIEVAGGGRRSPEERLREARYAAFAEEIAAKGATSLATGHSADDRVETLLLRVIAGSGPAGLGSIPPVRRPYVRPLIRVWRSEIEGYASRLPFSPRQDHTNLDLSIPRNRVRHRLLPLLQEEYNPSVKRALLAEAEMLASVAEVLRTCAARAEGMVTPAACGGEEIDVAGLRSLPTALRREVLASSLRRLGVEPAFALVEDIRIKLLETDGNARLDLSPRLSARRIYGRLVLGPRPGAAAVEETYLCGEGLFDLPLPGPRLRVSMRPRGDADPREEADGRCTAWLDAERLAFPLLVRGIRPGDRFHPLGAPGRRKLQDFLVDAKVPREERARVLVLESGGEIAWVMGMRIDERFKLRDTTTCVAEFRLSCGRRA